MSAPRTASISILALLAAVLLALLLTACGTSEQAASPGGPTALGCLPAAQSSLSTMAPDAKMLLVQTQRSVAPTDTPAWLFLFGSPSTDKTYLVNAADGQASGAAEYGKAGMSEADWAKVPTTKTWAVDSDEAYAKAYAASGAQGDPAGYVMGLLTYNRPGRTAEIDPLVWQVEFDPGDSGATTASILVDATTGETSVAK